MTPLEIVPLNITLARLEIDPWLARILCVTQVTPSLLIARQAVVSAAEALATQGIVDEGVVDRGAVAHTEVEGIREGCYA